MAKLLRTTAAAATGPGPLSLPAPPPSTRPPHPARSFVRRPWAASTVSTVSASSAGLSSR